QARHVEVVVLHGVHAAVEKDLVGLLGINLGEWIIDFLIGTSGGERQGRGQSKHGSLQKTHQNLEITTSSFPHPACVSWLQAKTWWLEATPSAASLRSLLSANFGR